MTRIDTRVYFPAKRLFVVVFCLIVLQYRYIAGEAADILANVFGYVNRWCHFWWVFFFFFRRHFPFVCRCFFFFFVVQAYSEEKQTKRFRQVKLNRVQNINVSENIKHFLNYEEKISYNFFQYHRISVFIFFYVECSFGGGF